MWKTVTPTEAMERIEAQRYHGEVHNLEEQALALVGRDIYERLVKGYTEKQWGRPCRELPAFIIRRLPVRMTYDNNYFNDTYQGIPIGGYNPLIEGLLQGCDTRKGVALMNYTDRETPFTRIIEHKHFETFGEAVYDNPRTVITREYPVEQADGNEAYYPINDERNNAIYQAYRQMAEREQDILFGGRLAEYRYYDMDGVIASAMKMAIPPFSHSRLCGPT